jgi:hypothetical protein
MAAAHTALLARAERALAGQSPVDAVKKVRAIVGPLNIPDSEAEAQRALEALRDGNTPTPQQLAALEVVVRLLRPVVLLQNGQLADLPETDNRDLRPPELKDAWSTFQTVARPYVGSIGRIEDGRNRHVGTGFVVGAGLVATNRHVLAVLSSGSDAIGPGAGRIVFRQEYLGENSAADIAALVEVVAIHPSKDIVVLRADTAARTPVSFADDVPPEGGNVVTIGFPGKDEFNNPLFLAAVFDGKFGVKRAALGEVLDGTAAADIFHDCSTTQGNSGSPVFTLATGKVAGIHRSGYFMYRNEAVTAAEIRTLL